MLLNQDGKQLFAEAVYLFGSSRATQTQPLSLSLSLSLSLALALAQANSHWRPFTGVMLTLLDERIEGIVRERILISYLRYKVHSTLARTIRNRAAHIHDSTGTNRDATSR
mgnify:CR=1 FL=1